MIQEKTLTVSSHLAIKLPTDRPMGIEYWPTALMTLKLKFYILIEQWETHFETQDWKNNKKINETNLDFDFRANGGPLDLLGTLLANVAVKRSLASIFGKCTHFLKE